MSAQVIIAISNIVYLVWTSQSYENLITEEVYLILPSIFKRKESDDLSWDGIIWLGWTNRYKKSFW